MKCFSCNATTSKYDSKSDRYYCEECTTIWQEAGEVKPKIWENDEGELPMLDEEFDMEINDDYIEEPDEEEDFSD